MFLDVIHYSAKDLFNVQNKTKKYLFLIFFYKFVKNIDNKIHTLHTERKRNVKIIYQPHYGHYIYLFKKYHLRCIVFVIRVIFINGAIGMQFA